MKIHPPLLVAAFAAILAAACSPGAPKPPRAAESPFAKYLWFDAEANFARFASQDSIRYWLDRTVEAGFNRIATSMNSLSRNGTRPSTPQAASDLFARRQS